MQVSLLTAPKTFKALPSQHARVATAPTRFSGDELASHRLNRAIALTEKQMQALNRVFDPLNNGAYPPKIDDLPYPTLTGRDYLTLIFALMLEKYQPKEKWHRLGRPKPREALTIAELTPEFITQKKMSVLKHELDGLFVPAPPPQIDWSKIPREMQTAPIWDHLSHSYEYELIYDLHNRYLGETDPKTSDLYKAQLQAIEVELQKRGMTLNDFDFARYDNSWRHPGELPTESPSGFRYLAETLPGWTPTGALKRAEFLIAPDDDDIFERYHMPFRFSDHARTALADVSAAEALTLLNQVRGFQRAAQIEAQDKEMLKSCPFMATVHLDSWLPGHQTQEPTLGSVPFLRLLHQVLSKQAQHPGAIKASDLGAQLSDVFSESEWRFRTMPEKKAQALLHMGLLEEFTPPKAREKYLRLSPDAEHYLGL